MPRAPTNNYETAKQNNCAETKDQAKKLQKYRRTEAHYGLLRRTNANDGIRTTERYGVDAEMLFESIYIYKILSSWSRLNLKRVRPGHLSKSHFCQNGALWGRLDFVLRMIVAEDWRASLKTEGSRGAQTGSSPEGGSSAGSLLKAGRTGKDAKTAVCEPTGEGGGGVVARIGEGLVKGLFFKVLQVEVCYDCGDWASHSCAICILLFINCSIILK